VNQFRPKSFAVKCFKFVECSVVLTIGTDS
jgi:hypothetical protein